MNETFTKYIDAQFIWTARNEISAKWSYVWAWDFGWINTTAVVDNSSLMNNPAYKEDGGNPETPPKSS